MKNYEELKTNNRLMKAEIEDLEDIIELQTQINTFSYNQDITNENDEECIDLCKSIGSV